MKRLLLFLLLIPFSLKCQVLLPGDANNDGRVNHVDVLAIGLNFGLGGPPRNFTAQGIDWTPKPFFLWPGSLPSTGINSGFSDCDGDGLVTPEDMLALKLNYDSVQNISQPPPMPYGPDEPAPTTARPKLIFQFDKDTATVKDTVRLRIFYEQPPGLPPAQSPMGVAFTLEYDPDLVQDTLTRVLFEPSANDLLYAAGATAFADARNVPPGRVEFGASGRRTPALSFSRPLGEVDFIIVEIIVRADTFFTDFKVDVSNVLFLDTLERVFDYDVVVDELVLYQPVDSFAVCPGDANNDGRVDNLDVLAIGLNYGREGIPRKAKYQGINWAAKPYIPWLDAMPGTGINLAFSDTDGDGRIDENDIKAIQLNYDSTHHLAYPPSQPYNPPLFGLPVPVPPLLTFDFAQNQAKPGDTLLLTVSYSPPELLSDEDYPQGVAFSLNFDETLIRDSLTRVFFPPDTDLLAAGGATRYALARAVPPGRVEIGVAGKDLLALRKERQLCQVFLVLEDTLPPGHVNTFSIVVGDVLLLNAAEQQMTAEIKQEDVGISVATQEGILSFPVRCFPSPVQDRLTIESAEASLAGVQVFDALGRLVWSEAAAPQTRLVLDTGSWLPGLYWLRLAARDGRVALRRVVK